jgi:hypothetical protein
MKLDPRFVLPAALAVGALALPSAASADPPPWSNGHPPVCPDHYTLTATIANPDWESKDVNGNFLVCHKDVPGNGDPTKDENGIITSFVNDPDPDNWTDDIL